MDVFSPAPPRESTPAALQEQQFQQYQQEQQQQFTRPSQPSRHPSHDPSHSRQPLAKDVALPEHCIRICLSGNKSSSNGDDPVQKFLQSSLNFQDGHSTEKSVMKYVKDVLRDGESRVGCNPNEVSYRRIDISVVIGTPDAIAKCTPRQTVERSAVGSNSDGCVNPDWFTNMPSVEPNSSHARCGKTEHNRLHGFDISNHVAEQDPTLGVGLHEIQQPLDPLVDPRLFAGSHTINGSQSVLNFTRPNSLHNPPHPYERSQTSDGMACGLQRGQSIPPDQFEPFGGGFSRNSSMGPPGSASAFTNMNTQPVPFPAHLGTPQGVSLNRSSARSRSQTPTMKVKKAAPARQRPRKNPTTTGRSRRAGDQGSPEVRGSTGLAHGTTSDEGMLLEAFGDLTRTNYPLDMQTESNATYGLLHDETNEDRVNPDDTTMVKHENPEEYAVKEFLPSATQEFSGFHTEEGYVGANELNPYGS